MLQREISLDTKDGDWSLVSRKHYTDQKQGPQHLASLETVCGSIAPVIRSWTGGNSGVPVITGYHHISRELRAATMPLPSAG
jgi:hypothetical protein